MNAFNSAFSLTKGAFTSAFGPSAAVAGTFEVTVQLFGPGTDYDSGGGGATYLAVSKTNTIRWMFVLAVVASGYEFPDYTDYTNYAVVTITSAMTDVQVAIAVYNAATTLAGFNVTRDGATLTFTASQTGDLTDSVGFPTPTITQGS